jgi:hypothetical protein
MADACFENVANFNVTAGVNGRKEGYAKADLEDVAGNAAGNVVGSSLL